MPGYTTYDAAIGVAKDNWTAQISGSNLVQLGGETNTSSGQFIKSEVPLRPRVLTLTSSGTSSDRRRLIDGRPAGTVAVESRADGKHPPFL